MRTYSVLSLNMILATADVDTPMSLAVSAKDKPDSFVNLHAGSLRIFEDT